MENPSEKTRVLNFLKKETTVDFDNIREVAAAYKHLSEIEDLLKAEKRKLESVLLKAEVDERFEDGKKVQFQEGREKTFIDPRDVYNALGDLDRFFNFVKINETALKQDPDGKVLAVKFKKTLPEKAKSSIVCRKMNAEELKEWQKG